MSLLLTDLETSEWSRLQIGKENYQATTVGCLEEVKLWKLRLLKRDANLADSWAGVFSSAM
jgi:hypothetical protein